MNSGLNYRVVVKLVLICAGLILTNHEVVKSFQYFLGRDLYFTMTFVLFVWASSILAMLFIAFSPSKTTRISWGLLIGLSTLAGDLYFRIVNDRLIFDSIEAMREVGMARVSMAGFYSEFIIYSLLSTAVLMTGMLIPPRQNGMLNRRVFHVLPLFPLLLMMGPIYYFSGGNFQESKGVPVQFCTMSLFSVYAFMATSSPPKSNVNISLVREPVVRHVVLIVGESIRGDFIDFNVPRDTTPWLVSQASSIANFGLTISASNVSNSSNAILRLGAKPETLGKRGYSILGNPSLWKYAKQAGFETTYINAQFTYKKLQNFMNKEEHRLIDHYVPGTCGKDKLYQDMEMAAQLQEILTRPSRQFVYVNKEGAHFPYAVTYPENRTHFSPAMARFESISTRERLVNSYKNAVRWSTDDFLEHLLEETDLSNAVIIYTSDHGQNLLEDGKPVTHGRQLSQVLHEAIVPLLVFTSHPELQEKFMRSAVINFNKASHFDILPTILNLFGYDPPAVRARYRQSLFESIDNPLGFASGDVTGRFGRLPVWNSRDGLESYMK